MSRFPLAWVAHLPKEQQKEFEAAVRNSVVLSRLKQILTERLSGIDKIELTDEFYSKPEVAHRQSHNQGRRRELESLLALVDF